MCEGRSRERPPLVLRLRQIQRPGRTRIPMTIQTPAVFGSRAAGDSKVFANLFLTCTLMW